MGLGPDHPSPPHRDPVAQDGRWVRYVVADHLDDLGYPPLVECLPLLDQDQHLVQHGAGALDVGLLARHDDLVSARDEADLWEEILDLTEMPVGLSNEVQHQVMAGNA